jgi:lysophospholipase L1-like esterase
VTRQIYEYHPQIGFRFIPNLKARIPHEAGGFLIRTNQLGFRSDRDFHPLRNGSKRRMLLFGDSFTAGDGVSNSRRYSDRLEELVPELEVYNFGLPGSGTDQQLLAYQSFALEIEHDLLMIAVLVENIRRVVARYRYVTGESGETLCRPKPYFELEDGNLRLRNVPVPRQSLPEEEVAEEERSTIDRGGRIPALRKLARKAGVHDIAQRLSRYQPLPEYKDPQGHDWTLLRTILMHWIQSHPGPVLVVPLPLWQYVEEASDPAHYQKRFRELANDAGCHLYDPLPDLLRHPKEARRRFRYGQDIHLTEEGHAALAAGLAPVVERLLAPAGMPTPMRQAL